MSDSSGFFVSYVRSGGGGERDFCVRGTEKVGSHMDIRQLLNNILNWTEVNWTVADLWRSILMLNVKVADQLCELNPFRECLFVSFVSTLYRLRVITGESGLRCCVPCYACDVNRAWILPFACWFIALFSCASVDSERINSLPTWPA